MREGGRGEGGRGGGGEGGREGGGGAERWIIHVLNSEVHLTVRCT